MILPGGNIGVDFARLLVKIGRTCPMSWIVARRFRGNSRLNRTHVMTLAGAFAVLAVGSLPAMAADAATIEPDVAIARAWSGCYVGANLGYARGETEATDLPFIEGPFAATGASWNSLGGASETIGADGSGAIGGVEAGCDYEMPMGSLSLVVGGAADISVLNVSGEGTSALFPDTNVSFNADWAATVRARVGIATPKVLVYATGGYAAAGLDVRAFDLQTTPSIGTMDVSGGGTESGWVIGGGAEWRMTDSCSLSFEYLRLNFDGVVATGPAFDPAGAFPRFDNDVDFDVFRVGLKWRL
jgi:outer membrane immunogenic protein/high affinity Mn2+ porin